MISIHKAQKMQQNTNLIGDIDEFGFDVTVSCRPQWLTEKFRPRLLQRKTDAKTVSSVFASLETSKHPKELSQAYKM